MLFTAGTAGTQLLQDTAGLLFCCWLTGSWFFFSLSLSLSLSLTLSLALSIHSGKLLKEDGGSMCCILFHQGRGGGRVSVGERMGGGGGAESQRCKACR